MRIFLLTLSVCAMVFMNKTVMHVSAFAQNGEPSAAPGLFESDNVLDISLKGNIKGLLANRSADAHYFPLTFTYHDTAGSSGSFTIDVKQRGHFRRMKSNCDYPPLLLDFSGLSLPGGSLFSGQSQLKLVVPCSGEAFIVREWLVYKLYNLLTPYSFKARLVKATLQDTSLQKNSVAFYGILLEDDKQLAKRNNMMLVKRKIVPQLTVTEEFLKMAMFEYLIGNTDWSVEYLQNINLLAKDAEAVPLAVPHDFDLSGIVNCPYAVPAEELKMSSVRERRYRGYCIDEMKAFDNIINFYNSKKTAIYHLYSSCALLDAKCVKSTCRYLDEFYSTINNAKRKKNEFGYPCNPTGTGNIVIKGLKK